MSTEAGSRIGIDVGGTRIKVAEVRGNSVLKSESVETPADKGPVAVMDAIAGAVKRIASAPSEIGMAIPGEVDPSGKVWRLPNIPGFEGFQIGGELAKRTGARVVVENDATTAAYGEALFGHGQQYSSFLLVTLGTGVGGGLVMNKKLVRGAHGFGAEIGHMTVDPSPGAPACACGNTGCLEAFAGTRALLETFRAGGGTAHEVKDVADSAHRGEAGGKAAFARLTWALGVTLNSIQNLLDLDAIVFSGGVSKSFDLVEAPLRAELRKRRYAEPLSELPLVVSDFGELAGVVGAAYLPKLDETSV
ncbi:MAG TPA: ROK family protein [Polyangiaceae bacterium]|jgi:glucokinase|nr:ROK family protein [Polyangiaceae bacterium]